MATSDAIPAGELKFSTRIKKRDLVAGVALPDIGGNGKNGRLEKVCRALPPHPNPLPRGEGASHAAVELLRRLSRK